MSCPDVSSLRLPIRLLVSFRFVLPLWGEVHVAGSKRTGTLSEFEVLCRLTRDARPRRGDLDFDRGISLLGCRFSWVWSTRGLWGVSESVEEIVVRRSGGSRGFYASGRLNGLALGWNFRDCKHEIPRRLEWEGGKCKTGTPRELFRMYWGSVHS